MVNTAQDWPVARTYAGRDLARISLPLGGIGTGTVGFGGRGQFRDWELENRPSKGLTSPLTFFACRVRGATVPAQARILEGALFDEEVEGWQGSPAPLAGLPRFAGCEFQATYPFGRAVLSDPHFPVRVSVTAFNPLAPGDPELSGLPLAAFRVILTSRGPAGPGRGERSGGRGQVRARPGGRPDLGRGHGRPERGLGHDRGRSARPRRLDRPDLGDGQVESGPVRHVAGLR